MLEAIEKLVISLQDAVVSMGEETFFYVVIGLNLVLGLWLFFAALKAHSKTTKNIHAALAKNKKSNDDPLIGLLPRGNSVIVPFAVFLFAIFVMACGFISVIPYFGLAIFELFNIFSRMIYKGKTKKVKKLYAMYTEEVKRATPPQEREEEQQKQQEQPEQVEAPHAQEQEFERVEPLTTPTVILQEEQPERPERPERPAPTPIPTAKKTDEPPKPTVKPSEQKTEYQPFEPKRPERPVSQTEGYNIERAPTYQVPRPPENPPVVDVPKQEEKPKDTDSYTIDDILARISQIKKEGATRQTMTELVYIIQKEREKNENKNPEQRQRLSEALSELLKAMVKS